MFYPNEETPFPDTGGGFCLETFALGGCEQPYAIRINERASLSDPTLRSYCGINEDLSHLPSGASSQDKPNMPRRRGHGVPRKRPVQSGWGPL